MSLDPIETTEHITTMYCSYLRNVLQISDPLLQEQFITELDPLKFVKGPILEITQPFETGNDLNELIQEGVLSNEFRNLNCETLSLDRPLYKHQENAIRKIVTKGRNVVVATGTGSGKTETFMLPVLNHLLEQNEHGNLTPGVRALLLYPMNALANDQLKRLRELLKNYPDITFGRYTGETEERQKNAEEIFRKMHKTAPLENELISREEMKKNPPHILLTNYAMLEYLLLRPSDNVFFDGEYANEWKFIVIDEAHTYTGAKGIETAMLLRRLKDRVVGSVEGTLRCILTSATLGSGIDSYDDVSKFASNLFSEPFEQQDIVEAVRKQRDYEEPWGQPSTFLYTEWQKIINGKSNDKLSLLIETGKQYGVPEHILSNSLNKADNDYKSFLYHVLKGDEKLIQLQRSLEDNGSRSITDVAETMFSDSEKSRDLVVSLVDLAVKARSHIGDQPLVPARYHLFVRSIEGAYLSFLPEKRVFLERREVVKHENKKYPVFEIGNCRNCGAIYLIGETEVDSEGNKYFKQPGNLYFEDDNKLEYYLILDNNVQISPDNEDENVEGEVEFDPESTFDLCPTCGSIGRSTLVTSLCSCGQDNYIKLNRVSSKNGMVHKCPACTKTNSRSTIVNRFLQSKDAIASVLATSLYQQMPEREINVNSVPSEEQEHDEWMPKTYQNPSSSDVDKDSRQLLVFSDNRQDAAFFAPYLNRTYSKVLRRHLILKTIKDNELKIIQNGWHISDLVTPLKKEIEQMNLFPEMSSQSCENEAWKWILFELLNVDGGFGLEGLGCIGFTLIKPANWSAPSPLKKEPWNLSDDEVWTLYQIMLKTLRDHAALDFPYSVDSHDEFFEPKNQQRYFRLSGSSKIPKIVSWLPSKGFNSRLDFLLRISKQLGIEYSRDECMKLLENIWRSIDIENSSGIWKNHFVASTIKKEGVVYQIDHRFWKLQAGIVDQNVRWYLCNKCKRLTLYNLKGVCPTYRCEGTLEPCDPAEILKDNHYRNLYFNLKPLRMRAEEHTAQLTSEAAAELQTQFMQGEVNVLSCSTTFELGVDVGVLESVFMRNVPPSAANYVQRAGRAGRRTDSTAFVLTFCKRSSHDLAHFNDPIKLVSGVVSTPHFEVENEKIVLRHVFATALAKFWMDNSDMFQKVQDFFFNSDKNGPEMFKNYLDSKPDDLLESLKRIVPAKLYDTIDLDNWNWVSNLFDENNGVLLKAKDEVEHDVNTLSEIREINISKNISSDYLLRSINTLKKRSLINYLSTHNVIPKYGFPVDVVELQIIHHSNDGKKLELDRDLRIALSEYAPSSQVVAAGNLWTSRYLKKIPEREWPKYTYAVCDHCHRYQRILSELGEKLIVCESCNSPLEGRKKGTFIVPEFGFIVSNSKPQKPGDKRPERTYSTRTYYSGESKKNKDLVIPLKGLDLRAMSASHGKMAIINNAGGKAFKICQWCGFAVLGNEEVPSPHKTSWGGECKGKLVRCSLGHEYMTDILQLSFDGYENKDIGFWFSLLYAFIEGAADAFDIDRQDLDGCLYPSIGEPNSFSLLLFDNVPGGAGHVKRIIQDETTIESLLKTTYQRMQGCTCGGEDGDSSCYGCLRNYGNQFCHDELNRGKVINFLESYCL
ncbi:MAG: hypothetical protein PWQ50_22 [Methanolobus sp.]|nr:hypothetical protein [Methanolobus sp.]